MGPVFITVIGQCMGAGEVEQAGLYFTKLLRITLIFSAVWNGLIFCGHPDLCILLRLGRGDPAADHSAGLGS